MIRTSMFTTQKFDRARPPKSVASFHVIAAGWNDRFETPRSASSSMMRLTMAREMRRSRRSATGSGRARVEAGYAFQLGKKKRVFTTSYSGRKDRKASVILMARIRKPAGGEWVFLSRDTLPRQGRGANSGAGRSSQTCACHHA